MIDEPSDGPGGRDPIDMDSLAGHEVHGSFTYFQEPRPPPTGRTAERDPWPL